MLFDPNVKTSRLDFFDRERAWRDYECC